MVKVFEGWGEGGGWWTSHSRVIRSFGDVTIVREVLQLSCNTCCDTGLRFLGLGFYSRIIWVLLDQLHIYIIDLYIYVWKSAYTSFFSKLRAYVDVDSVGYTLKWNYFRQMTIIKSLKQKSMHLIGVDFFFVIIFKGIKIFFLCNEWNTWATCLGVCRLLTFRCSPFVDTLSWKRSWRKWIGACAGMTSCSAPWRTTGGWGARVAT